ncbi:Coiled-coil domain-containing protein 58 [Halocaridina rubra]|uniref:Protein MIX23 n=1 Tax=Halocaridina rubra TaxID=373956 RepID=A0AAN8XP85_HALRR
MAAITSACEDIADTLRLMRSIDDKIVYQLNLATPTQSFRGVVDPANHCKGLYDQLNDTYLERGSLIEKCLNESREVIRSVKTEVESKRNDPSLLRKLRTEQNRMRDLQNELIVEEIVRERSLKVFEERCRQFYKPPKTE